MGRKTVPQALVLEESTAEDMGAAVAGQPLASPIDSKSPKSPRSPFRFGQKRTQGPGVTGLPTARVSDVPLQEQQHWPHQQPHQQPQQQQQQYSSASSATQPPLQSPGTRPSTQHRQQRHQHSQSQAQGQGQGQVPSHGHRQRRDGEKASKSGFFFNFNKATRSSDRVNIPQQSGSSRENMSRDSDFQSVTKQSPKHSDPSYFEPQVHKPGPTGYSRADPPLSPNSDYDSASSSSKKGKPKPFTLLTRTRSIKDKDNQSATDLSNASVRIAEPERAYAAPPAPLRTAPIQAQDRSFRDMMASSARNHSAERGHPRDDRDPPRSHAQFGTSVPRGDGGSTFFSSFKASSSKAANIIGKGLFGNSGRGHTYAEREPAIDDEHYVLKVINLPLVEQTRRTRISKKLEDSRDKTEFWMPAFPWRAIDYLNYKGSDVEGLYRVPGSGPQIKRWQRKFDEEGDVDLFQQEDLYDINIIGSMLKAWLRELPDELFPKEAQDRIARECAGADKVPPLLIEELSNLSPFNYYLLFAITCHLSLLLAHSDKNKMDFRNLCICFQPCMKIDAFCFKFLVCDWRECWKGCKNEAKFIEEEYALFDSPPPPGMGAAGSRSATSSPHPNEVAERRAGTTTPSEDRQDRQERREERYATPPDNRPRTGSGVGETKGRLKKRNGGDNRSIDTTSTISTNLTVHSERDTPPRGSGDLRPLSPIKPLSPLGF